jgi:hypothetical protein
MHFSPLFIWAQWGGGGGTIERGFSVTILGT